MESRISQPSKYDPTHRPPHMMTLCHGHSCSRQTSSTTSRACPIHKTTEVTPRIDLVLFKCTVERCLAGYRSAKAMARGIRSLLSDEHIYKMKEGETLEQASSDKHPVRVVLFTEKTDSTWLYKSLSWKYHDFASFYEIHSRTNRELIEAFNIQQFPSLLVLKVWVLSIVHRRLNN